MTSPVVTIVLPAYREESTIEASLTRLISCLDLAKVPFIARVVVDGPHDRTAEIANGIGDPRFTIVELHQNFGKGYAIREGFEGCKTEYVGYLDADLDLHPEGFVEALRVLQLQPQNVCGALGSKVHPDSAVEYPSSRRIMSSVYKTVVRIGFSLKLSDTQTGLKVFRTEAVNKVLTHLQSDGFEFDLELLSRLSRHGYTFVEVPVSLDYRFGSTINLKTGLRALLDTIKLAVHLRRSS